jgi:hypothetical protein
MISRLASTATPHTPAASGQSTAILLLMMRSLPAMWGCRRAARYLAMNGKRRLIGSFWHGSMANAMAQAACHRVIDLIAMGFLSERRNTAADCSQVSMIVRLSILVFVLAHARPRHNACIWRPRSDQFRCRA